MGTPAISSTLASAAAGPANQTDATIRVLAKLMKTQKEQGEALVQLISQSGGADGKGTNVNYYA